MCLAAGSTREAVDAIFNCVWAQGLAGDQPENWKIFCEAVGLTEGEANLNISDPDIKTELRTNGAEALEAAPALGQQLVSRDRAERCAKSDTVDMRCTALVQARPRAPGKWQ